MSPQQILPFVNLHATVRTKDIEVFGIVSLKHGEDVLVVTEAISKHSNTMQQKFHEIPFDEILSIERL